MPATDSFRAPPHMPREMSVSEWRALVHAAKTGWLGFVFPFYEIVLTALGLIAVIALHRGLSSDPSHSHFSAAHDIAWALGWFLALRVVCRSIEWTGKRKLAYRIGLLPDAIREY